MESVADLRDIDGRGDRDLVRDLEVAASLNLKSFFDLELEVQELTGEHLVLDSAAGVGLNGPLRGLEASCSFAVAPPGIGRQSLHMMKLGSQLLEQLLYFSPFHYNRPVDSNYLD